MFNIFCSHFTSFFFLGGVDFKDMDVLWKQKREGIEVKKEVYLPNIFCWMCEVNGKHVEF